MSGWRKLLSPHNEKYQLQESSRSNLMQSKFAKDSSLKSSEREWLNGSLHNHKLQSLQSEMSKLKSQLGRYSQRHKSMKDPVFTPTESTDRQSVIVAEENENEGYESDRQRNNHNLMSNYSERPVKDKKPMDMDEDYQYYNNEEHKHDNEEELYENNIESYNEKRVKKERGSFAFRNDGNGTGRGTNTKEKNRESSYSKKENRTNSNGRKSLSYNNERVYNEENEQDLQLVLSNCQNEILELKGVVFDSRKKIEALQDDLENEKKETGQLREELQRRSVKQANQREIDYTNYESPLAKENRPDNFGSSRGFKQEKQFREDEQRWFSNDATEEKQYNKMSSTKKGNSGIENKVPPSNYRSTGNRDERNQVDRRQRSVEFGRNPKNASVQCDFMLENIANVQDDAEKEQLKEEIAYLRKEAKELKAQKNEMIESFQRIIQTLQTPDKNSSQNEHVIDMKSEFKHFYRDLDTFLSEIKTLNTMNGFDLSRRLSPYQQPMALSTLERSKTLDAEQTQNRVWDMPYKDEYTSFYDNLADSKNPLQFVSKIGSPPSRKNKEKTLFDSWRSHVQDLLSNDPKNQ